MASLASIKQPIQDSFLLFQSTYDEMLSSVNPTLGLMMEHIKQTQGKQMRPILVLLSAGICGGITQSTINAAVALELLHSASLVHDDVVDDSNERRGMLSAKAKFNNKIAILGGDFMLSTALIEAAETENISVIKTLSSLGKQLSEGELYQMENTKVRLFDENAYFNVIKNKTAALFAACAKIGSISSNNIDIEKELKMASIGEQIGICFQIKDDIFDFIPTSQTGKPSGKDLLEGKITLPLIYVYNNSDNAVKSSILSAIDEVDVNYLQTLALEKGGIEYATKRLENIQNRAIEMIEAFPPSQYRNALVEFVKYVAERKN